ncbi:hypothetical protein QYE76_059183, partial [Lolium multiflorum]
MRILSQLTLPGTPQRNYRQGMCHSDWYDPCLNVMIVDNNDEDPATYEEAMMSPDSNKWQEAMKSEMGSMYDNKVWTLVDLLDSRKAVENKWIFKRKTDADAIAAFFDYEIWQMDVKTAFLNGDIDEELYMGKLVHGGEVFNRIGVHSSFRGFIRSGMDEEVHCRAPVVPSALDPLVIYCDNMGAIANAQEPRSHKRLKHIKLRYHSIREYIEDGELSILSKVGLVCAGPATGLAGAIPGATGPEAEQAGSRQARCRTLVRACSTCHPGRLVQEPVVSGRAPGQPTGTRLAIGRAPGKRPGGHRAIGPGTLECARCAPLPGPICAGPAGVAPGAAGPYTGLTDIGIPDGPAEDGTWGLLKAHESKNMKLGSPISCC